MALSPGLGGTRDASPQEPPGQTVLTSRRCPHPSVSYELLQPPVVCCRTYVLASGPASQLIPGTVSFPSLMRAGGWGFGGVADGNRREAATVGIKAKITLLDFTASQQNAVQHLGQEQPPVCGDEHLPDHIHRQPEPAHARLETGL